jgi:threonine dehydrogenase-like Zn-dependent dehydrogenase
MKAQAGSFDFILNTVSASHNLDPFIELLKRDGTLTLVGVPEHPHPSPAVFQMIFGRKSLAGSLDRRHRRDAGDAGFLLVEGDRLRYRDDRDARSREGLRAHAEERREISFRDQHGNPAAGGVKACVRSNAIRRTLVRAITFDQGLAGESGMACASVASSLVAPHSQCFALISSKRPTPSPVCPGMSIGARLTCAP